MRDVHENRLAFAAIGIIVALVLGFYAMYGNPTPAGAFLGCTAIVVGIALLTFASGTAVPSVRVAGKTLRKTEILGLLIFIFMATIMLVVGMALFYDWLAEPTPASGEAPIELGPIAGVLRIAGEVPLMAFVIGVEVIGAISLIALYVASRLGHRT